MNRRAFLTSAGATVGAVSTMGLSTKFMYGQSTPPNPTIYNALISAHAIAVGNKFYATPTANDWNTVNNAANACLTEWRNNGRDAGVQAGVSRISASDITTANIDSNSILSTMQAYQGQFTLADVNESVAFVNNQSATVTSVLQTLQSAGMSYYLTVIVEESAKIAQGLANGTIPAVALRADARVTPSLIPPPPPRNPPGGGDKGYDCATDGALIFAAGLAFATLSVMSLGSFDILAGAAWAGIAAWGGLGTTGWGVGHVVAGCGF